MQGACTCMLDLYEAMQGALLQRLLCSGGALRVGGGLHTPWAKGQAACMAHVLLAGISQGNEDAEADEASLHFCAHGT
jgi:hypothetical protein